MSRTSLIAAATALTALGFVFACTTTEIVQVAAPEDAGGKPDGRTSSGGNGEGGTSGGPTEEEPPCKAECEKTLCKNANANPSEECGNCIQPAIQSTCKTQFQEDCAAEQDCTDLNKCLAACTGNKAGECAPTLADVNGADEDAGPDGGDAGDAGDAGAKADAATGTCGPACQQGCAACCSEKHQDGVAAFNKALQTCACTAPK